MSKRDIDFARQIITDTQRMRALSIGKQLHEADDTTIKSPVAVTFTDAYGCEITTWHGLDGYEHVTTITRKRR